MRSLIPSADMKRRLAHYIHEEIIHQIYKENAAGKPIVSYQSIMMWGDAVSQEREDGAGSCTYYPRRGT